MADPTLNIRIAADLTAIKNSLAQLSQEFTKVGAAATKSGKEGAASMNRLEKSVTGVTSQIKGLLASFAVLQSFRAVFAFADEFQQINGVLKLATKTTEEFTAAQEGVFRIAQATRAPVQETANTYGALERTTRKLGLSQDELLRTLETVNKAIGSTPVSAQAAQASLVQFGQALGGDFKAGAQELNSILEQTPGLAIAIAKGLGVETSELKKLGEEGKLSTELVVRGLLRISDEVDQNFSKVPRTLSGAIQQIKNDLTFTLGRTDLTPLIESLDKFRAVITDPSVVEGLTSIAGAIVTVTTAAVEGTAAIANFTKWIGEELAAAIHGPAADDLVRIDERITSLKETIASLDNNHSPLAFLFKDDDLKKARTELAQLEKLYADGRKAADEAAIAAERKRKADAAGAVASKEKAEADFKAAQAAAEARAREEEAAKEAEKRQKKIQDTIASLKEEAATFGKTSAEVVRYQLSLLGASEAQIKQAMALADQIDKLKAESEAQKEAAKAAEEHKKAEQDLNQALDEARARLAEAQGDSGAVALQRLKQEKDKLLADIAKVRPGDQDAINLVNKLFDVESARVRASAIKAEADKLINDLKQTENSISNQVSAGIISQAVGEQQLHEARERTIEQLKRMREALQELYNTQPTPETLEAIKEFDREIGETAERNLTGLGKAVFDLRTELAQLQQSFTGNALEALADGLTDLFVSIADGSKSAKEALRDFALGFARAILEMIARALALMVVIKTLDAISPGLGKLLTGSVGAGVHHSGGIAGMASTVRRVNPALFGLAPRYHEGGIAGLAPNEVPAILQKGEEVVPRSDPRHRMNGGGQDVGNGTRVVNVFDPNFVPDQMDSAAGEKVILNVIGKNPGRVKQLLG